MTDRDRHPPRPIARLLALGFGSVSAVTLAMCALLLLAIEDIAGTVESMRRDETAIRQGMELAAAVRELSLQVSRYRLDPGPEQLALHAERRQRVRALIQSLAARIPDGERHRLEQLGEVTQRLHDTLLGSLVPAVERGDAAEAREAHRVLGRLGDEAAGHADHLAGATRQQMAHAHDDATRTSRLGLVGGGLGALAVVVLAVMYTLRLKALVLRPLQALTDAALRYGRGDFGHVVSRVGVGELAAVEDAFTKMAKELADREASLLQTERMAAIGQLAAGIAHELNNPIGIIRGYLKTMRPDEAPETLREELAILDEEAAQCQRIAEDLLAYARSEALERRPIAIERFLTETARRFRIGEVDEEVQLDVEPGTVEADAPRLRQVLLNLLNNARQVSPDGAPIRLRGRREPSGYRIEVADRGPGVEPSDRDRVFEPFFTKRKGGSGLGLSVCQGIVRAHGGSIEVDDEPGGGAVFRLRLPTRLNGEGPR